MAQQEKRTATAEATIVPAIEGDRFARIAEVAEWPCSLQSEPSGRDPPTQLGEKLGQPRRARRLHPRPPICGAPPNGGGAPDLRRLQYGVCCSHCDGGVEGEETQGDGGGSTPRVGASAEGEQREGMDAPPAVSSRESSRSCGRRQRRRTDVRGSSRLRRPRLSHTAQAPGAPKGRRHACEELAVGAPRTLSY